MYVFFYTMPIAMFLLLFSGISKTFAYQIPDLTFEKLEDGFRVSIPQDKDVSRVAFNINRNRPFTTFEEGDFSKQVREPENGRFTFEVKRKLEDEDKMYAWIFVQYKNLVYRKITEPFFASSSGTLMHHQQNADETEQPVTSRTNVNTVDEKPKCEPTITKAEKQNQKLEPKCSGDLIFEENFDGSSLNSEIWTTEVRLASDICGDEFVLYNASNVHVNDGILKLKATLWNDNKPGTEVRQGLLDLGERCTEPSRKYCQRQPMGANIMPPVISGRINTKSSFSFQFGRVVIRAKFPAGDWLYPVISLEPELILLDDPQPCFQVRIAFSRGNQYLTNIANTEDIGSHRLTGGVILTANSKSRDQFTFNRTSWDRFSNEFHIYETIWNEQHLIFKVDDTEYGRLRVTDMSSSNSVRRLNGGPFNRQFALTLGLAAGGHADFPERDYRKPWVNTGPKAALRFWEHRENWLSTWSEPSLNVDYVRVYAV